MTGYWFRKRKGLASKDMGWGFMPITWQGWVLIVFVFILIGVAFFLFDMTQAKTLKDGLGFLITTIALITTGSFISWKKCRR